MKKTISMLLVLVLCLGLVTLTGCGDKDKEVSVNKNPFEGLNLDEYITLPDYSVYTTEEPSVSITDGAVDKEIQARLEAAAKQETVKEGTAEKGDKVLVDFKGTLEDGSSPAGMNASDYEITLGNGGFIDGFEEGIFGTAIGETVTLDLEFPDPYPNNSDLAGKPVTFEITVKSKVVSIVPELDEAFIKANSDVKTEAEYRDVVKAELEQLEYDNQLYNLKRAIYEQIVEEAEVLQYPEGSVDEQIELLDADYKATAENYGYEDWNQFLTDYFNIDQAEYDEQLRIVAESLVKQELIIYSIAEKEAMEVSDEEYQTSIDEMLDEAGLDEATFETYFGMTIYEYAEAYSLYRDLLLTKELDAIYDSLEKK